MGVSEKLKDKLNTLDISLSKMSTSTHEMVDFRLVLSPRWLFVLGQITNLCLFNPSFGVQLPISNAEIICFDSISIYMRCSKKILCVNHMLHAWYIDLRVAFIHFGPDVGK